MCVNPIGSHLLSRGGNCTFGNYGCRAGRIGRRLCILLGPAIRAALLQKLDGNGEGDQEALRELIRTLDSDANVPFSVLNEWSAASTSWHVPSSTNMFANKICTSATIPANFN